MKTIIWLIVFHTLSYNMVAIMKALMVVSSPSIITP